MGGWATLLLLLRAALALFGCAAAAPLVLEVFARSGGRATLLLPGLLPGRDAPVLPALFARGFTAGLFVTGALLALTTPAPWNAAGLGVAATWG